MTRLTTHKRDHLSERTFALPGRRFPIPDKSHARAALSGASRALHVGNITEAEAATVRRKAEAKLEE